MGGCPGKAQPHSPLHVEGAGEHEGARVRDAAEGAGLGAAEQAGAVGTPAGQTMSINIFISISYIYVYFTISKCGEVRYGSLGRIL